MNSVHTIKGSSRTVSFSMVSLSTPSHHPQWISVLMQIPNPLLSFSLAPKNHHGWEETMRKAVRAL